ncbi:glycosyltransferase [Rhizobium sp. P44RR-XXIV]|uniref:glycosyltransferase n=1 Tax=Rhizobium sp. P44RR-XXIV TaxID=1921145 RepID=UPI000984DE95|nr:glycosyltransferase [Rhizobium sp. P44RR-XXIV]TIX90874.1 glycosyltransferase family 4 protein [Rhizobium sp. P44RR-XXIV]
MQMKTELPVGKERSTSIARKKILYIQPGTSSFAGIERVVDTICTALSDKYAADFDIDVLYTSQHKNRPSDSQSYNTIDRIVRNRRELMLVLRSVFKGKDYDLIVVPQIEPTVICMIASIGIRRNFAMHLHGNPRLEPSHLKAKILFLLMRIYFIRRLSYVFGTSPKQLESFRAMFKSKVRQYWLPNPVRRFDALRNKPNEERGYVTFVNVGRFSVQKGQDILLRAFAELHKVRENVKLKVVGYGPGEAELRDQIKRLNLETVVSVEHYPDNPSPALAASDVYVSTSRWEGWSLAICEALRFGLPVVSTDCEFGPSDILVDRRLGLLVPVAGGEELVNAMIYYCDNLETELSHAEFRQSFIDSYDTERVVDVHADALRVASIGLPRVIA